MYHNEFDMEDGPSLADIIQELERRLALYGDFIPYKLERNRVESLLSDKANSLHYYYCLYYAVKGGVSTSSATNIFELITDSSLKNYFCTDQSEITSIGQNTTNLLSCIESIKDKLGESKGNFEHLSIKAKDGGIDIITYKPIDSRGNQIVCLTDATIGRNWNSQKKVYSKLKPWKQFIHFKVDPITCLSVVHIIDDAQFHGASNDNGLLFDRARIMRFFTPQTDITTSLNNWLSTLA